jgi:hypothetical protein
MKRAMVFAAGVAAGISIVVACGQAGKNASASPSDCGVWQATFIQQPYADPANVASYQITDTTKNPPAPYPFQFSYADFPAGWQPFAYAADGWAIRRCKP